MMPFAAMVVNGPCEGYRGAMHVDLHDRAERMRQECLHLIRVMLGPADPQREPLLNAVRAIPLPPIQRGAKAR